MRPTKSHPPNGLPQRPGRPGGELLDLILGRFDLVPLGHRGCGFSLGLHKKPFGGEAVLKRKDLELLKRHH